MSARRNDMASELAEGVSQVTPVISASAGEASFKIFPFAATVGLDELKLVLILNIINPSTAGVLIRGEKGTAKSMTVRALADILPRIEKIKGCPFNPPGGNSGLCPECGSPGCPGDGEVLSEMAGG
jgi:Mg-chelatase subunit ChlI